MKNTIYIVLASYNGELFIEEQINSIIRQKLTNWKLIVHDDGSTDKTISIVKKMAKKDNRIILLNGVQSNVGAKNNFSGGLMEILEFNPKYICFSDQDDIWDKEKLSSEYKRIKQIEAIYGPQTPVLIHTDLEVIDAKKKKIYSSFMRYHGIYNTSSDPLKALLVQNFATGCTMMFNRSLLYSALPIPKNAVMHDWWIALCAAAFGKIDFYNERTVQYRQHSSNVIGAKSKNEQILSVGKNLKQHYIVALQHINDTFLQAIELRKRWDRMEFKKNRSEYQLLSDYLSAMNNKNPFIKTLNVLKLKMKRQYFLSTPGFYMNVFLHENNYLKLDSKL